MFGRDRTDDAAAQRLFEGVVQQSRNPAFYGAIGVPDTLDGRFEMLCLHLFLVLRRLRQISTDKDRAGRLAQSLFDAAFANIDANLREMGVGDLSVGNKVKDMAAGFYGRVAAYDRALDVNQAEALTEAVRRNVFGTLQAPTSGVSREVASLAAYMRRENDRLTGQDLAGFAAGDVSFGPPPGVDG